MSAEVSPPPHPVLPSGPPPILPLQKITEGSSKQETYAAPPERSPSNGSADGGRDRSTIQSTPPTPGPKTLTIPLGGSTPTNSGATATASSMMKEAVDQALHHKESSRTASSSRQVSQCPTSSCASAQYYGVGRTSTVQAHYTAPKSFWFKRQSIIRGLIQGSKWYHSKVATRMRAGLHGKWFALCNIHALLIALFLPDMWVLLGVDNDNIIDLALTVVMVFFVLELLCLSACDATYFLGFFFFMDLLGTFSMLFDISFMLGHSHTQPDTFDEDGVAKNLMLLRATRAARVGARAGRLSRVLRMMKFLPFLRTPGEDGGHISKAISGQLANLLATRVACLTIVLVMVIPIFEVLTFPQIDYSMRTWVNRVSQSFEDNRPERFAELSQTVNFFRKKPYGPFRACAGVMEGDTFRCFPDGEITTGWSPVISTPPRGASVLQVYRDDFMIAFNMHQPKQVEAAMSLLNMVFVILVMVFSGLALTNVVTMLAVRPLQKVMVIVKEIATTVFKLREGVEDAEDSDDEGEYDIDSSSEMMLLEKVVQKLAAIAELQARTEIEVDEENMEEEDIGILNMMQGKNVIEEKAKTAGRMQSRIMGSRMGSILMPHPSVQMGHGGGSLTPYSMSVAGSMIATEKGTLGAGTSSALLPLVMQYKSDCTQISEKDFGVSAEVLSSLGFNALPMNRTQRINLAVYSLLHFYDPIGEDFVSVVTDKELIPRFVEQCEKEYLPNPFHNFAHALDVLHSSVRILRNMISEAFLSDLEQYSILIAAIAHDLGHPGVNNGFLSEVSHDLAVQYNDKSPLENMHCAKLYTIVANEDKNVFSKLTKDQYREVRKDCIEAILHTDMMGHQAMVKELQMTYQVNSEVFAEGAANPMAEQEVFMSPAAKSMAVNTILHSADVSNPCRFWEVSHSWAMVVLEEFFAQGDQEKDLGIPVQFLNDRDKLNRPNSQIGFIEFMIAPFFVAQIRLWPNLYEFGDQLANNLSKWEQMWVTETSPAEEDGQKVSNRVNKVKDNLEAAKTRRVLSN